ncbi:DUF4365 domain-containing protein [Paenibacillus sp. FSL R10-2791]|uniref:DUF4365 domain-containing protein n=1 Tax=Paenibacillus sp. FSL R10-2791 TaxID=2954695 RepID=UPI0030F67D08
MGKDHTRLKAQEGVHEFGSKCAKLNYLFRELKDNDKGVDGEIELTQSSGVKNPFIAVQIKARSKVKITKKNEISLTVTSQNIEYWRNYGRPVILILFVDNRTPMYWVRVDNLKSRTFKIPITNQFDETTLSEFLRIISEYYTKIAMNLDIKDVSVVLSEFGFVGKLEDITNPLVASLNEAMNFIERKEYDEACMIYEALAKIYKESSSVFYNLAIILLKLDKIDEAFEVADVMYRKFPNNYETYEIMGSAFASIGEYEGAENQYAKALFIKSDNCAVWNLMGLVHYWDGEFGKAIQDFKKSLSFKETESVLMNLALCLTANLDYIDAVTYYDKVISLNNLSYDAYNNKGIVLKALWKLEDAIEAFEKAIAINLDNLYALCNLAFLLKDLGEDERALHYYQLAVEISPQNNQIHLNIGLLFCRLNNYQYASLHFEKIKKFIQINSVKTGEVGLVDIGYKVAYLITIDFSSGVAEVIDVENSSQLALFENFSLHMEGTSNSGEEIGSIQQYITPFEPSNNIIKGLIKRNEKVQQRKNNKMNKGGFWVIGATDDIDNYAFAIFSIEDENYYNKIIKEIRRKIELDYEMNDKLELSIINDVELKVLRTVARDSHQQIEIRFENRLFQQVYFNINFNGYYLAGIATGDIKKTYPFLLSENDLSMSVNFTCSGSDGRSRGFIIEDIKRISVNKKWE